MPPFWGVLLWRQWQRRRDSEAPPGLGLSSEAAAAAAEAQEAAEAAAGSGAAAGEWGGRGITGREWEGGRERRQEGVAAGRVWSGRPPGTGPSGRGRSSFPAPRGQVHYLLSRVGVLCSPGLAALARRVPLRPGRPALLVASLPLPAPFAFTLWAQKASSLAQG